MARKEIFLGIRNEDIPSDCGWIDETGIGGAVFAYLREAGVPVNRFSRGEGLAPRTRVVREKVEQASLGENA